MGSEDEVNYNKQMLQVEDALKKNPRIQPVLQPGTKTPIVHKATMCRFFKEGRCANGASCQFAHDASELKVIGVYKLSMCKFHLEGKCLNGEACSYAHHERELIHRRARGVQGKIYR